jgi:hypothetical protein
MKKSKQIKQHFIKLHRKKEKQQKIRLNKEYQLLSRIEYRIKQYEESPEGIYLKKHCSKEYYDTIQEMRKQRMQYYI